MLSFKFFSTIFQNILHHLKGSLNRLFEHLHRFHFPRLFGMCNFNCLQNIEYIRTIIVYSKGSQGKEAILANRPLCDQLHMLCFLYNRLRQVLMLSIDIFIVLIYKMSDYFARLAYKCFYTNFSHIYITSNFYPELGVVGYCRRKYIFYNLML